MRRDGGGVRTNDNALLRAIEVLDALFHQSVVVREGHSDRVLYDEINDETRSDEAQASADEVRLANVCGLTAASNGAYPATPLPRMSRVRSR
jgi:hypothetical protein